jgi:hypothetical protein
MSVASAPATRVGAPTHARREVHSARTAQGPVGTAIGPAEVAVSAPGDLLRTGKTNGEHIRVSTPVGDLHVGNTGYNQDAEGKICKTHLVSCD